MSDAHELIEACHALLEEKLVARTWGNVSVRLDGERFLITPSGRDYVNLRPEDVVEVSIDGSYDGAVKPSSEKNLHAHIYAEYPDARLIVHTHQPYASALSMLDEDIAVDADLGAHIGSRTLPIAGYGLPSTKRLHRAVLRALERASSTAALMRAHGAVIVARDADEAFATARAIEAFAAQRVESLVGVRPGDAETRLWHRDDDGLSAKLRDIFDQRADVQVVLEDSDRLLRSFKSVGLPAYLDDFSQIVGISAGRDYDANLVFDEFAAYALAANEDDAEAVDMIARKNAMAAAVARHSGARPLSLFDRILMNQIYKRKYSKLK